MALNRITCNKFSNQYAIEQVAVWFCCQQEISGVKLERFLGAYCSTVEDMR